MRTDGPGPRAEVPGLRVKPRGEDPGVRTDGPGPRAEIPGLRVKPRGEDPGLRGGGSEGPGLRVDSTRTSCKPSTLQHQHHSQNGSSCGDGGQWECLLSGFTGHYSD